jgi:hypothetical protein
MTKKETYIAIVVGIVTVLIFIMLGFFGINGFGVIETQGDVAASQDVSTPPNDVQVILDELSDTGTVADLRVSRIVMGEGEEAAIGDTINVHYIGVLADGTPFDSSRSRGAPFAFTLGVGQVIQGWDQALVGSKVGDRMIIAIPPQLGYGAQGAGSVIPPNATLLFDVEVLEIQKP